MSVLTRVLSCLVVCIFLVLPGQGRAAFVACNDRAEDVVVAIGFHNGTDVVSHGWWSLGGGGGCTVLIREDLTATHYAWFATDGGEMPWQPDLVTFCVHQTKPFEYLGNTECAARDAVSLPFQEIARGDRTDIMLRLGKDGFTLPAVEINFEGSNVYWTNLDDTGVEEIGQHGAPVEFDAQFSHCETGEGAPRCYYLSNGWAYEVASGGPNPDWLLEKLAGFDTQLPVHVQADLIDVDVTRRRAGIFLRMADDAEGDALQPLRKAVEGTWQSSSDPALRMRIVGGDLRVIRDADQIGQWFVHAQAGCPGLAPRQGLFIVEREGTQVCYAVVSISETEMVLQYDATVAAETYRRIE